MQRRLVGLVPVFSLLLGSACGKAVDDGEADGTEPDAGPDTGDEICLNGTDDDEDTRADCADPKCGEVAACVPVSAALGLEAGTLVEVDAACPTGFGGGEVIVNQGLEQGSCAGCGCTGATDCAAAFYYYLSAKECAADTDLTGGTPADPPPSEVCGSPVATGLLYGARVEMTATPSCAVEGTGAPGPTSWERSMKFCLASQTGVGCAANEVCVPRAAAPEAQCALARGEVGCTGFGTAESDWYTGVDDDSDTRACGACSCLTEGGDCDGVFVQTGTDYTCGDDPKELSGGEKICFVVYSPPVIVLGEAAQAECTAAAEMTGEIGPSGRQTLCCAPE